MAGGQLRGILGTASTPILLTVAASAHNLLIITIIDWASAFGNIQQSIKLILKLGDIFLSSNFLARYLVGLVPESCQSIQDSLVLDSDWALELEVGPLPPLLDLYQDGLDSH